MLDFALHFEEIYVCRFFDAKSGWQQVVATTGEWKGVTAGGCSNFDTVGNNPQYLLTVADQPTTVVINLSQTDTRGTSSKYKPIAIEVRNMDEWHLHKRCINARGMCTHGRFALTPMYSRLLPLLPSFRSSLPSSAQVYNNNGQRITRKRTGPLLCSNPESYVFRREISLEQVLQPSATPYTIIVSTFNPGEETHYSLIVYATSNVGWAHAQ
jgi:hypothetical protein